MDPAAPPVMVKASVLAEKLNSAIGDGVDCALLMTTAGALLTTASAKTGFARSQECRMLAALVANIWRVYAQSSGGAPSDAPAAAPADGSWSGARGAGGANGAGAAAAAANSDLELVLAELETHRLCCVGLGGRAVLALFATSGTELGLLKLKAASLQGELYEGLRLALRGDTSTSSRPDS
jgi:predicted regulator of Ras-like GTPase activity (Roadblock/LC7/MglB family)